MGSEVSAFLNNGTTVSERRSSAEYPSLSTAYQRHAKISANAVGFSWSISNRSLSRPGAFFFLVLIKATRKVSLNSYGTLKFSQLTSATTAGCTFAMFMVYLSGLISRRCAIPSSVFTDAVTLLQSPSSHVSASSVRNFRRILRSSRRMSLSSYLVSSR